MTKKILEISISYTDWKNRGFSKGTLHHMKQNAKDDKSFTLNVHVWESWRYGKGVNENTKLIY